MIKGEVPFVKGTPEMAGKGNRINTYIILTSNLQRLLFVWWRGFDLRIHLQLDSSCIHGTPDENHNKKETYTQGVTKSTVKLCY